MRLHHFLRDQPGGVDHGLHGRRRIAERHEAESLLKRLVGDELGNASLPHQSKLGETERAALLLDDLYELHRRLHKDGARRAQLLSVQELGFHHRSDTAASADQHDPYREIGSAEILPIPDTALQDFSYRLGGRLANRIELMHADRYLGL